MRCPNPQIVLLLAAVVLSYADTVSDIVFVTYASWSQVTSRASIGFILAWPIILAILQYLHGHGLLGVARSLAGVEIVYRTWHVTRNPLLSTKQMWEHMVDLFSLKSAVEGMPLLLISLVYTVDPKVHGLFCPIINCSGDQQLQALGAATPGAFLPAYADALQEWGCDNLPLASDGWFSASPHSLFSPEESSSLLNNWSGTGTLPFTLVGVTAVNGTALSTQSFDCVASIGSNQALWVSWIRPGFFNGLPAAWMAWLSVVLGLASLTTHYVLLLANCSAWSVPEDPAHIAAPSALDHSHSSPMLPTALSALPSHGSARLFSRSRAGACGRAWAFLDSDIQLHPMPAPVKAPAHPASPFISVDVISAAKPPVASLISAQWPAHAGSHHFPALAPPKQVSIASLAAMETLQRGSEAPATSWLVAHWAGLTVFTLVNVFVSIITCWELDQAMKWARPAGFPIPVSLLWLLVALGKAAFAHWGQCGPALEVFVQCLYIVYPAHCGTVGCRGSSGSGFWRKHALLITALVERWVYVAVLTMAALLIPRADHYARAMLWRKIVLLSLLNVALALMSLFLSRSQLRLGSRRRRKRSAIMPFPLRKNVVVPKAVVPALHVGHNLRACRSLSLHGTRRYY